MQIVLTVAIAVVVGVDEAMVDVVDDVKEDGGGLDLLSTGRPPWR